MVLYAAAAFLAFRAAGHARASGATEAEVRLWQLLTVGLVLLGINKQLDLQSALTELGRYLAHQQGWYEARRVVQFAFILVVLGVAMIVAVPLLLASLRMPGPTRLAVCGALFLGAFVVVRAASFHHVDELIGTAIMGLRWNWALEMGGLLVILAGAVWRCRDRVLAGSGASRG